MTLAIGFRLCGIALVAAITLVLVEDSHGAPKLCRAFGGQQGHCVPFPQCPPLLAVLKSPAITGADINMLKALTCDFENPKICCSQRDILLPVTTSFNNHPLPTDERQIPTTTATTTTTTTTTSTTNAWTSFPNEPGFLDEDLPFSSTPKPVPPPVQDYSTHRNFELLPKISECGSSSTEDNIIGGKDVAHGGHPWMVRIGYRNVDTNLIEYYCAGTVISKRYILTAAHCTEEIDTDYITEIIQAAEHNTTEDPDCSKLGCSTTVDYPIEKIIAHPDYSTDDKFNDIGIIKVGRDIEFNTFVKPVCLPMKSEYGLQKFPSKTSYHNRKGLVAGWGRTKWNRAEGSTVLQEVFLPVLTNSLCQEKYGTRAQIIENQMCAGGIKGKDSCGGDSGGPFILPLQINVPSAGISGLKFFQVGVVSYGPVQCGVGALPGVYTDVQSYLGWILDNMEP